MTVAGVPGSGRVRGRIASVAVSVLVGVSLVAGGAHGSGLTVSDLNSGNTAAGLADALAGAGVTVDAGSVVYTGDGRAAGTFSGGAPIVGFENGVVLSSGQASGIVGPNNTSSRTTQMSTPGDADLTALAGMPTFDASVLTFDFDVGPHAEKVYFRYVFGSEEYNEWVGSQFNDVFAFFVNGSNCAVVGDPPVPVAVNTVNNGRGTFAPVNEHLFVNNDPFHPDSTGGTVPQADLIDTQMDGLTVVLTCEAGVEPGTNSMKLAVADTSDASWDTWVLIEQGSLTTVAPGAPGSPCAALLAGRSIDAGEVCASDDGEDLTVTYTTGGGWTLAETHLHVADDAGDVPQTKKGNPRPGRFDHRALHGSSVTTYSYTIPLADLGAASGSELVIAAHASVTNDEGGEESAWGAGERFSSSTWATYFTYSVP